MFFCGQYFYKVFYYLNNFQKMEKTTVNNHGLVCINNSPNLSPNFNMNKPEILRNILGYFVDKLSINGVN